jgi:hypothetical protein
MKTKISSGIGLIARDFPGRMPAMLSVVCLSLAAAPTALGSVNVANYTFSGNVLTSSDTDSNSSAANFGPGEVVPRNGARGIIRKCWSDRGGNPIQNTA